MITIGEAMRKTRLSKGYSQAQLSRESGISVQNIYFWEIGHSFPTIINLIPIADALGVSLDELVGRRAKDACVKEL